MPRPSALAVRLVGSLPFYYGWVAIAVAFVSMAIGVNARTVFSLLFPPILAEFQWDRSATAAIFSTGFLVSVFYAPVVGNLMDRLGPRYVVTFGALTVSSGLALATQASALWHLYLSLGVLAVGSSIALSYVGHGAFVPNWFARKRGLTTGIAFSGVGVGSIILFPWLQTVIDDAGWRAACWSMAVLVLVVVVPLNVLLQHRHPEDLGLEPDGGAAPADEKGTTKTHSIIVDKAWAETPWTLGLALRTARFWWCFVGFFAVLFAWYSIQVHQTKYLFDVGFSTSAAALALGLVPLLGIGGQIGVGYLSDRIGREWAFTLGGLGFAACYGLLLVLKAYPSPAIMYSMVAFQGLVGYGMSTCISSIIADLFQGRHYGRIYGAINVSCALGPAVGPWVTGYLYDTTGSYAPAFWLCIAMCFVAIFCIWMAAPRKVRLVAGQAARPRSSP
jgi:MFS family permease